MKTQINNIIINWKDIKNKCRTTVGKKYTNNEPSDKFKQDLLISEHSPIRLGYVDWSWQLKSWVATHWSRHKFECFISTQRTDRTGKNREELRQDEIVLMDNNANMQNLIDVARKRLCHQCSKETREYMEDLKFVLHSDEKELSDVLVPNCIYRCGCPEFKECGYWSKFLNNYKDTYNLFDIKDRYLAYNSDFEWRMNYEKQND